MNECPNISICQNICNSQHTGNGRTVSVSEIRKIQISISFVRAARVEFLIEESMFVFVIGNVFFFSIIFSFYLYGPSLLRLVICNFPSYFFMDVRFINLCKKSSDFTATATYLI